MCVLLTLFQACKLVCARGEIATRWLITAEAVSVDWPNKSQRGGSEEMWPFGVGGANIWQRGTSRTVGTAEAPRTTLDGDSRQAASTTFRNRRA